MTPLKQTGQKETLGAKSLSMERLRRARERRDGGGLTKAKKYEEAL